MNIDFLTWLYNKESEEKWEERWLPSEAFDDNDELLPEYDFSKLKRVPEDKRPFHRRNK